MKQLASTLGLEITIEEIIVENEEQAKALQWPGSPTVRIKGVDIDPSAMGKTSYAMTLRTYPAAAGHPRVPGDEMIRKAFAEAGWIKP